MRKRRTRYSERNTKFYNKGSHTVGQVVLSVAALFLVVIFLVVLCTDPLGNNGCGPSESMMTSGDAPETADSDVSQSNDASSDTAADTSDQTSGSTDDNMTTSSDWCLLLVNSAHPLADDYSVDLTELRNGQSVDTRILSDLQEMFDAARSEDIYPIVSDAYRTREDQQTLMDDVIQNYEDEGYSSEEASSKAEQVIAKPGTSEHETGLAIDIAGDDDYDQDTDSVLEWMNSNAYKYGFILRYPSGKESVTGAEAENDHYRYVGKEAAKVIHDQGICLEEYLSQNN
ncbi:MAG: M15 family metallopeptidase [Coprococcus sp.]